MGGPLRGISERKFPPRKSRSAFSTYLNGVFLTTLFTEAIVLQTYRKLYMVVNQKKKPESDSKVIVGYLSRCMIRIREKVSKQHKKLAI
jgi:hypothetical protein